ncbi:vascular endothelial growth factor receptor kdr-like isoform X2 [Rhineura floridana]|uniref:vascular endothelial growth factor receptor kdr-like isoform X2 n=1 Tax=Rhineura floridana TaxID=261503 RepID=UPI002AC82E6C|nr:vascular endothelial growth factor receptor kdr-like isoform X2 [Rhineura floridana]
MNPDLKLALALFLLHGLLWLHGLAKEERLMKPELDFNRDHIIVDAGDPFTIICRGSLGLTWLWRKDQIKEGDRWQVYEKKCSDRPWQTCSTLAVNRALANDTGYFTCLYRHLPSNEELEAKLYVFIRDNTQPFVEIHTNIPDVIFVQNATNVIVPCRVTSPDIRPTLLLHPSSHAVSSVKMEWDPKRGFLITSPTFEFFSAMLKCVATIRGDQYTSYYMPQKVETRIKNLALKATPQKLLVGDTLSLECSAETFVNGRIVFVWTIPGRREPTTIRNLDKSGLVYKASANVVIKNVTMENRGLYACRGIVANTTRSRSQASVTVTVYRRAFLRVSYKKNNSYEILEGQKMLKLAWKVDAFPRPKVTWYKDGKKLIAGNSDCYDLDPVKYRLLISDVRAKHAGNYTISLSNAKHDLHEDLTIELVVLETPRIYEKETDFHKTELVTKGGEDSLQCTASGTPLPTVHWEWEPCSHADNLCKQRGKRIKVEETAGREIIYPANKIKTTDAKHIRHGNKLKVISTLETTASNVSGVYFCVASNKVGTEERSIKFYVSDVPSLLQTEPQITAIVASNVQMTCKSSKYIYNHLSWYDPTLQPIPDALMQKKVDNYSISLTLDIKNVSQAQAGLYKCRARTHPHSTEGLEKSTMLNIKVKSVPYIMENFTDLEVNISGKIVLECKVNGTPKPIIAWLKNGYPIAPASGISMENNTLVIERVKKDDEGHYACKAVNEMGQDSTQAFVKIEGSEEKSNIEVIILVCTGLAATLFWLLLTLFIRKLRKPDATDIKTGYLSIIMDPEEMPLDEQCDRLPYDSSKWEFPRDRLRLGKTLGHGAFGKVVEASAFGIDKSSTCKTVAVKMLKECATTNERKALMSELKILIHIGHHLNVVNLLGACTKPGGPLMVIVEYCKYGNLSNYLRGKRGDFIACKPQENSDPAEKGLEESISDITELIKRRLESVASTGSSTSSGFIEDKSYTDSEEEEEDAEDLYKRPLTLEDLICYSFQVAKGMEFLASRKCIHRDLAARNILLSENNVVKICDFGLARDIYKDPDYVRKGDARLPLKWMAPEAIFDKIYTTQSDVWSFGVLLWEIFSLGASPYPGVQIDEDFCRRLKEGTRMRSPEYSTLEIYQTMLDCWHGAPTERPTFTELVERLGDLLQANVQQDGKDYIPLNITLCPDGDSIPKICILEEKVSSCIHRWSTVEACINTKNRPLSVKTFDEVSVEKEKMAHEECESDSGMVLTLDEIKSRKRLEIRSWPYGIMALARKAINKSKESVFPENERESVKYQLATRVAEDTLEESVLLAMDPSLECHSPPPDYSSVIQYSAPPV